MSIHHVYFDVTKKAQAVYGKKTVLFMQVGSFFEIYAVYDEQTNQFYGSQLEEVARLCDLATPRKQYTVNLSLFGLPREGRLHMAGFQPVLFERQVNKLQDAGYTILIYVQTESTTDNFYQICPEWFLNMEERIQSLKEKDEQPHNTIPHILSTDKGSMRILVEILSPGSMTDTITQQTSNYVASIWFTRTKSFRGTIEHLTIGIGLCNSFTSETHVYEYTMEYRLTPATLEQITRLLTTYQPREYLIVYDVLCRNEDTVHSLSLDEFADKAENYLEITHAVIHRTFLTEASSVYPYTKQIVQQQLLEQWYKTHEYHSFEATTMLAEYPVGIMAFVYLLSFLQEHNSNFVKQLQQPCIGTPEDTMLLANHSLQQLNILGEGSPLCSVEAWVNRCKTPMGKRRFHHILTHPTTHHERLTTWYNAVESAQTLDIAECLHIRTHLEQIRDIERDFRRIVMNSLKPRQLADLIQAFEKAHELLCRPEYTWDTWNRLFKQESIDCTIEHVMNTIQKVQHVFKTYIRVDACQQTVAFQFEQNLFHPVPEEKGLCELHRMDTIYNKHMSILTQVQAYIQQTMSSQDKKKADYSKLHETDKQIYIVMTKRRAETFRKLVPTSPKIPYGDITDKAQKESLQKIQEELVHDWRTHADIGGKTSCALTLPTLKQICQEIAEIREKRTVLIREEYFKFLAHLNQYRNAFQEIVDCMGVIDIVWNHAYLSTKYDYHRPTLLDRPQSYVDAKELRHILIEQIQRDELYVPNDIRLDEQRGILLYGTNAVGKSSLIRSLGISIILAQAGMYVPCYLEFSPFAQLFTRILGNDNIFKGLSTFMVEMTELNTILTYATENSLVLGDELCSGTEIPSAISIFTSALEELVKRRTCFMFATHFHELTKMPCIHTLMNQGMRMMHLSVYYDTETNSLVYDRYLRDGSGSANYGLEVCRAIQMPASFLERANQIRLEIVPEEKVQTTNTPYSMKRMKTTLCEVCKSHITTEVHHLTPQQFSKKGRIQMEGQTFHKHHPANLISVCGECHDRFHETTKGHRRVKTTKGYKLIPR